jgi:hypothetical protein
MSYRTATLLKTAIWLFVLLGLGMFAYHGIYLPQKKQKQIQRMEKFVFQFNQVDVVKVICQDGDQTSILDKVGVNKKMFARWQMNEPVKAAADDISVNSTVGAIWNLEYHRLISSSQITTLSDYGLDPPRGKITIFTKANEKFSLLVGNKSAFENLLFLKEDDKPEILVVSGDLERDLLKSPFDLRRKRLLDVINDVINQLTLKHSNTTIKLIKTDDDWWLISPTKDRADNTKVSNLIRNITQIKAISFPSPDDATQKFGFQDPVLNIEISFDNGTDNQVLVLGQVATTSKQYQYYAQRIQPTGPIAQIRKHHLTRLTIDPDQYRIKSLLDFRANDVYKIKSSTKSDLLVLEKSSDYAASWSMVSPKAKAIESSKAISILRILSSLSASNCLAEPSKIDLKNYGLDSPVQTITLFNQSGNSIQSLKIGNTNKTGRYVIGTAKPRVCILAKNRLEDLQSAIQSINIFK